MPDTYRLVTRSDFDGLVCAALLKQLGILDDIKFVHPKDVQDGKVEIGDRDITTNVPYVPAAHLAFDHHSSEAERVQNGKPQPRDHPHGRLRGPRGLRLLRRRRAASTAASPTR